MRPVSYIVILTGCIAFWLSGMRTVSAEVRTIEADSTYVMGDNDTGIDARRIAVQEAKKKALELAGTFVESQAEIRSYRLTRDEVTAYTAGLIGTEIVSEETRDAAGHPEICVKTRCIVDTDSLLKSIERYGRNEELKEQLQAAAKENEDLRKERDGLIRQLAAEKDKTKAEATRKKLDTVLSKEEANGETRAVWAGIGSRLGDNDDAEIGQADLDNAAGILEKAVSVNPQSQQARFLLACVYQRKGDPGAAEGELRAAMQRNPSNPALHMKLGILLRARGNKDEALKEFHFVERLRPHNPLMLFYTGITFRDMNRCGISVVYLDRFLKNAMAVPFAKKRDIAVQAINGCGGERGGYHHRVTFP